MTPKEWVDERAEQWVAWRERNLNGGLGYGNSAMAALQGIDNSRCGFDGSNYVIYDNDDCLRFESAVNSLADPLRVIVRMHWLGSERWMLPATAPVAEKAGRCGVSERRYYRLLERARETLYVELH